MRQAPKGSIIRPAAQLFFQLVPRRCGDPDHRMINQGVNS